MNDFFVSPEGDDAAPGTEAAPFATLRRARDAARGTDAAVVHLRAGTHTLTETFALTEADSGTVYQAHGYGTGEQETVLISGGRVIDGWREAHGVWTAEVGDLDVRQLYVDGERVERAGVPGLPEGARATDTGYATTAPVSWRSPSSVEFVYRGVYPWTEARIAVAAVTREGDETAITMAQPAYDRARDLYNYDWSYDSLSGPGMPTRVENDPSFLTEPGTFALDRAEAGRHVLHYLPRPGEHPGRTRVVAPALETLVRVSAASDLAFKGLAFAESTWLGPTREGGFLHYHSTGYYTGGGVHRLDMGEGQWLTIPSEAPDAESGVVPACVDLDLTQRLAFERCVFTRLGATALNANGGNGLTIRTCDFGVLSAAAVEIRGTAGALVEDNTVERVGLDFAGAPGISISDTTDCVVAHNRVAETPHCGIVAGPGRGTRILRNVTTGTMSVLADGGGIYLSGPQGDSHENGAQIAGNVITDTRTPYNFGLYTDYGAAWVTLEHNVVARGDNTSILHVAPPLDHVVYRGNHWDADPVGSDAVPEGVTYEHNTTTSDPEALDAATAEIRAKAGPLTQR
ncbi:right-handed parallel beta-helix repeat-containing protein [Glycomyces sp. NPDC046736]|uniref:right-handed parallel beta-helix repeat-containing protein n=1 Tax=Glycomyces sp. NPDC046736 TaxID=3155615 RepID=UPI003411043E